MTNVGEAALWRNSGRVIPEDEPRGVRVVCPESIPWRRLCRCRSRGHHGMDSGSGCLRCARHPSGM